MTRKQALPRVLVGMMVALTLAALATTACAAPKLKIGDAAPNWSGLTGVDGKQHSLSDYEKAKLVVVVFTCNHCPVAKAYEDRLIALQKEYAPKGVQFVAINPNSPKKQPEDSLEKMKERASSKGFNFPYVVDATQQVAKDYGATCTPHIFVLDQERKVAYMGAIDDSMNADKVKEPFLRNALDALLKGEKPAKAVTKQFGCGIKWE